MTTAPSCDAATAMRSAAPVLGMRTRSAGASGSEAMCRMEGAAETLAGRRTEAEQAEHIVVEEVVRFRSWRASLNVVPAIASLRARAEQIRSAELAKVDGRVSEDERRTLESVTSQILNKLLHLPTVRMKEAAVSSDGAAYADAVRHLFGLEDER